MKINKTIKALDLEEEEFIRNQREKLILISKKLNEDLIELIKIELRKKFKEDYIYNEIKKKLLRLIKIIILKINESIYNNKKNLIEYKLNTIIDRDFKIIYDIIILILKYFPNKLFELEKYKISNVRKYFIYKINIKPEYKDKIKNEYLIFNYSDYEINKEIMIYVAENLENLKFLIKDKIPMLHPIKNLDKSVSLDNSENSNLFNSSK